ncbi:CBO0543 family protein [Mangrovibacillus sp. Mu-81]|uniref:CBO0543 family protein n=1 Tax=Mangrovibacillus sp. Mu-81 TaxID=3121478 RepID=UPI002FE4CA9D
MIKMIISPISPKQFDENELFTLIISITVVAVLSYLHKHYRTLSDAELLSVYLFNIFLTTTLEALFAEHPLDFYDTMDYPHAEIFDVILQTFVYPATVTIAIHFYAKYRPAALWYILGWGLILTFLEWISLYFNLFQHKEWTLFYSCILYSSVMTLNTFFFNKVRKHLIKNQHV